MVQVSGLPRAGVEARTAWSIGLQFAMPEGTIAAAMPKTVALLILLVACAPRETVRPPIILISVDTLRSDRLPAYGYAKGATPHIDALRRDAVLYLRTYSHAPLTLPSHVSMLTGLLPNEHGVRNNIGYTLDATRHRTAAAILRDQGYRTGAAVSSFVLRRETGLSTGFDVYDDAIPVRAGAATAENQRPGSETLRAAQHFLAQEDSRPPFLFFHIYEPHAPYTPAEPFRSRLGDAYDGEIAAADAVVGELVATLKQRGLYDGALIIFTSDHGEALWEHGEDQHGILLYREVLQVPLIIKRPGSEEAGQTVEEPFALARLFDEMVTAAGALAPKRSSAPIYSETYYPRIHLGWSELRSMIEGRHHYIESSRPELYDLAADPGETKNIIADQRRAAASMRAALQAMPQGSSTLERIDPEEAKKLEALGYIGRPQQRTGPLPNPRDEIHLLRDLKAAFQLAAERRDDEAVSAFRALLRKNPALTDVSTRLAELLLAGGRNDEAVAVYRAAITHAERVSADLALALSVALLKTGQTAEAVRHAELALAAAPYEAHEVIARAAIEERRIDDAAVHVRAALDAAGGRNPRAFLLVAELHRAANRYEEALQALERAGGIEGVEHMRADIFARMDRPDDAIAAYRREIARHPGHLQSYANLAVIYRILGRAADSEAVLREMLEKNPHAEARALARRTREAF